MTDCARFVRTVLFAVCFVVLLPGLSVRTAAANQPTQQPLNLLLITADDLGIQLGCYGDAQARTPRLDQFAKTARRFEVAWVAQASCSPSRSAMLSGLYPHANGQYGLANALKNNPPERKFHLHDDVQKRTVPHLLKPAGYFTGCIGKLHVNPESSFDFDFRGRDGFGSRDVRRQAELTREFLQQADQRPWFLMANVFDPHVQAVFEGRRRTGKTFFPDRVKDLPPEPRSADDFQPFPFQQIEADRMMERVAGYYNCVERADAGIGMILDAVEASGQSDRTVLIIMGDHGPPVGRGKTTCYEAGLRVPFLVRWPGLSSPGSSTALVSAVDIVPTFLDAAGLAAPDDLHGRSLRPVLASDDAEWRTELFAEFQFHGERPYFPRRCVRTDRFKLIHNPNAQQSQPSPSVDGCPAPSLAKQLPADSIVRQAFERMQQPPEWELYDLQADPWEWQNLAEDSQHRDTLQQLQLSLMKWRQGTNDPFLSDESATNLMERIGTR